jgi:hypothetical protein
MKYKDNNRAETMRQHIEACKESKQSIVAYCKDHQLAPSKFYYWQKRLNSATAELGFTQVSAPTVDDTAAVTIHFPSGIRIVFSGSVSLASLKELACCI